MTHGISVVAIHLWSSIYGEPFPFLLMGGEMQGLLAKQAVSLKEPHASSLCRRRVGPQLWMDAIYFAARNLGMMTYLYMPNTVVSTMVS